MNTQIIYHRCHYCNKKQIVTGGGGYIDFQEGWNLDTFHPMVWEAVCPECKKKYRDTRLNNTPCPKCKDEEK